MSKSNKKSREDDGNHLAGTLSLSVAKGETSYSGADFDEKHPNTKLWSEEKKAAYLEANTGRIRALVSGVRNIPDPAISSEDLFQEAQMAFWKAYESYDPERGTLFTTYAYKIMKNAVTKLLRTSGASKRKPVLPPMPFDTVIAEDGSEYVGGDNQIVESSPLGHTGPLVEEHCIQKETVSVVFALLQQMFSEEERKIFLDLSQGYATQVELAKELKCSQAKISMTYRFVKIRLNYELQRLGYAQA